MPGLVGETKAWRKGKGPGSPRSGADPAPDNSIRYCFKPASVPLSSAGRSSPAKAFPRESRRPGTAELMGPAFSERRPVRLPPLQPDRPLLFRCCLP